MNGKPVLFTTVFQWEAKREQIFWIIIDISMFTVEFEIATQKLEFILVSNDTLHKSPKLVHIMLDYLPGK